MSECPVKETPVIQKVEQLNIYQLKVTLLDIEPAIWRQIYVLETTPLNELHDYLQVAMGWYDCHLHSYQDHKGECYETHYDFDDPIGKNEQKYLISDLLKSEGDKLHYTYDFGDNWRHEILLEQTLPYDKNTLKNFCIAGKRACPPEDCGGVLGYQRLVEVLADSKNKEYQDAFEWLRGRYDPDVFERCAVNKMHRTMHPLLR